jgi:FAD/FMN-containing dehydrogenase
MSPIINTGITRWANRHETYVQPLQQVLQAVNLPGPDPLQRYNAMTAELRGLIARALQSGTRVRALGGGWSFSGAPATDGLLLDTSPLNLWFRIRGRSIHPAFSGPADGLYFVQCGNSIAGLNRNLRAERRSLRTTGASNGQTIVGAMSTGTHGAALNLGAVQDYVVGIHLVLSPERHIWLERASYPVTVDGFAGLLGAEPLRDDDTFNAVLVGLGAFGLVHGVMIETDPIFLFEVHRKRRKLDASLRRAISALDFTGSGLPGGDERPRHFEVLFNPYDLDPGPYVTTMYQRPYRPDYPRPTPNQEGVAPGDDALGFIGTFTDTIPPLIPKAVNFLVGRKIQLTASPIEGDTSDIFPTTTTRGQAAGTGIGVPIARVLEVVDLILAINRDHGPFPCLVALRFVPRTGATLGFTRFDHTCVIDVDGPLSNRTRSFYSRIWQALATSGISYTMHWGKLLGLSAAEVRRLYGDAVDRWLGIRRGLLSVELRGVFSNRFLEELDLAT